MEKTTPTLSKTMTLCKTCSILLPQGKHHQRFILSLGSVLSTRYMECQWIGMPGLDSRFSTYWPTKRSNKWRCSQHTSADQTPIPCVTRIQTKRDAPALSDRARLASAAKPINAAHKIQANIGAVIVFVAKTA